LPRTADQITASMIQTLLSATSAVSNFNIGSLVRSLSDATSAQIALLEKQIQDQVAAGILNAVYQLSGVYPLPAAPSVYQLQFTNTNTTAQTIPQGTQATIPNSSLIWSTQTPVTVPAQSGSTPGTATVNAICLVAGSGTNVPANTITQLVNPIAGISVTNPSAQAIVPGTDAETQTQTQARAANQRATWHRGDAAAIEAGVLTDAYLTDSNGNITEQVNKVKAVDYSPGQVYVYAVNATNGLSSNMVSFIGQILTGYVDSSGVKHIGYKAAGIIPTVLQAVLNPLIVSVSVLPASNTTFSSLQPQVVTAINNYFASLDIEQGFSFATFVNAIMAVAGVADVVVSSPAASLPGVPYVTAPSAAPTLTAVTPTSSTNLAAGTYYVQYTFINAWGETTASPQGSVTLTAGQEIQVSAITLPVGATGVNYYLSTAAGSTTTALAANGNGGQIDLTTLPASGAANPPSSNTALIHGNLYTVSGNPTVNQMVS